MIGQTVNGARLWVHVGPLEFQPGELAKIMLIVFLAGYLREKREVLAQGRRRTSGRCSSIWGAAMLVLVETNDLGSALLYFGIFLAMLYVATARLRVVAAGRALFLAGSSGVYHYVGARPGAGHDLARPVDGPVYCATRSRLRQDCQLQLVQSLYSIGNGDFGGTGLGRGTFTTRAATR